MQPMAAGAPVAVEHWGSGPRVVLVHGAMTTGAQSWDKQRSLASRWTLVVPDRRGYGRSGPTDRSDFEVDAGDVSDLLADGAHLVGHSYGAIVALFAAARRPDAVRSLTVIEPPAHSLARGHPDVEAAITDFVERHETIAEPAAFQRAFLKVLGFPAADVGDELAPEVEKNVRVLMGERPPWDLVIPVDAVRSAGFATLVVSGGHNELFEMLCDVLADRLAPRSERAVLPGRRHLAHRTGAAFNDRLEAFLLSAER